MTEHDAGNEADAGNEPLGNESPEIVEMLRARSAAWQAAADDLSAAASEPPPPDLMADPTLQRLGITDMMAALQQRTQAEAQRARLTGEVDAAQAFAVQALLDEGGPTNHEAYWRYYEVTKFNAALLPGKDAPHEPGDTTTG